MIVPERMLLQLVRSLEKFPTGRIMKTFLAHLAAKPERHRAAEQPQALALDAARCAAVRDGSSRGGHRLRCKDGADPDRARGFALSVLHPRGSGRCRSRRAGTGPAGHRPQRRPRPLRDHGLSEPYGSRSRQRRCIRPDRGRHGLGRRATATQSCAGGDQRERRSRTRGSPHVDPRYRARRDDRDRRATESSILSARRPSGCSALPRRKSSGRTSSA